MQLKALLTTLATLALTNAAALPDSETSLEVRAEDRVSKADIAHAKDVIAGICGPPFGFPGYNDCGCGVAAASRFDFSLLGLLGIHAVAVSGGGIPGIPSWAGFSCGQSLACGGCLGPLPCPGPC